MFTSLCFTKDYKSFYLSLSCLAEALTRIGRVLKLKIFASACSIIMYWSPPIQSSLPFLYEVRYLYQLREFSKETLGNKFQLSFLPPNTKVIFAVRAKSFGITGQWSFASIRTSELLYMLTKPCTTIANTDKITYTHNFPYSLVFIIYTIVNLTSTSTYTQSHEYCYVFLSQKQFKVLHVIEKYKKLKQINAYIETYLFS